MSQSNLPSSPIELDLPSEGILAWEHGDFSQTDYGAFLMKGDCDVEAFQTAIIKAQESRPTFHANLIRIPKGLWGAYAWQIREKPVTLEVRDFTTLEKLPNDFGDWIHTQMTPEIQGLMDLSSEYPVRFILFKLPQKHYCLIFLFHHVVSDGGGIYDFLREAFSFYHELVKGSPPEWADVAGMHAQAGDTKPVKAITTWDYLKREFALRDRYPFYKAKQFATSPETVKTGRHIIRYIIDDPAMQKALRDRARKDGGSLTDLMISGSKLAIAQWNESRNEPVEPLIHGVAVNQRLRRDPLDIQGQGNPMSAITILSDSKDQSDSESLLKYVIEQRKMRLNLGYDVALAKMGYKIFAFSRLFPMSIRHSLVRIIYDIKISHFITNLGVIWPEIEDGRPTGRTAIQKVGDLELLDIHSSVGTTGNNGSVLIIRSFLGKLYMVMVYGRYKVNDADAKEFSQLVYDKVISYIQ